MLTLKEQNLFTINSIRVTNYIPSAKIPTFQLNINLRSDPI